MILTPVWIIGFSGHRNLPHPDATREALLSTLQSLQSAAALKGAKVELYTSAAAGADLLALSCARSLNIPVHLLLPLPEADFAADFEGRGEEWAQASEFIAAARRGDNGGTTRVLRDHPLRDDCYYGQVTRIVDACDLLLVVWDGEAARGPGGTGDAVELAKARHRPLLHISSVNPKALSPAEIEKSCPAPDAVTSDIEGILTEHSKPALSDAAALQKALDSIANEKAPAFRRGTARVIKLHAAAALLGAVPSLLYLAFIQNPAAPADGEVHRWEIAAGWFTAAEFAIVSASLLLTWLLARKKVKTKWLRARFAAEVVRSVRASRPWLDPLHPQIVRHLPEWHTFAVTAGLMASGDALASPAPGGDAALILQAKKTAYITGRLQDQRKHFEEKALAAKQQDKIWHGVAKWAAILAPPAVLFALLDKACGWHLSHSWTGAILAKFLPVALPLTAGVATALRSALDITRRSHRYPEMEERLQAIAEAFPLLRTEQSAATAVARTEELLTDELIEWRLAAEHAGAH